jgi:hypothetical protein
MLKVLHNGIPKIMSTTIEIITSQDRNKMLYSCSIWQDCDFHSPVMEKSGLLESEFASLDKWFLIFRRNVTGHFTSYVASHPKILKY